MGTGQASSPDSSGPPRAVPVWLWRTTRIGRFSSTGTPRERWWRNYSLGIVEGVHEIHDVDGMCTTFLFSRLDQVATERSGITMLGRTLKVRSRDESIATDLRVSAYGVFRATMVDGRSVPLVAPHSLGEHVALLSSGDLIIASATAPSFRLLTAPDYRLGMLVRWDAAPEPTTDETWQRTFLAAFERLKVRYPEAVEPLPSAEDFPRPEVLPLSDALLAGADGSIWLRHGKGESRSPVFTGDWRELPRERWTRFSTEGMMTAEFRLARGYRLAAVDVDGRMIVIGFGPLDETKLYRVPGPNPR